jgi:hypothetical protein
MQRWKNKSGNSKIKKVSGPHFKERGHEAACMYSDNMTFDPNEPIVFTHDEPEFDGS